MRLSFANTVMHWFAQLLVRYFLSHTRKMIRNGRNLFLNCWINDKERQELVSELLDRRVRAILRQFNTLSMCANIAPMLGLLGTVTGMVDAFMGLGTAMGPEKASILAISISQALYTTAAGLLVAIPAIACTVFFRNTLEKRVEQVTTLLEQFLKHLPAPEQERPVFSNTETAKLPR